MKASSKRVEAARIKRRTERSISVSEIKRFLNCRLRWYWSSAPPRGLGLSPIVDSPALSIGRLYHEVLQEGYDSKKEVPFADIFREKAQNFQPESDTLMFQEYKKKYEEELVKGVSIIDNYQHWAEDADKNYKFIATETEASGIKVEGTPATISVIIDALVETDEGLWVMDFKTTGFREVAWTQQDLQATMYTYAAKQLFDPEVQGVIFRFLYKSVPQDYNKLILKSGKVTTRKGIVGSTTFHEYYRALAVATLVEMVKMGTYVHTEDVGMPGEGPSVIEHKMTVDDFDSLDDYNYELQCAKHDPEFKERFKLVQGMYRDELYALKDADDMYFWDKMEYRTNDQIKMYFKHVIVPTLNDIVHVDSIGPTGLSAAYAMCGRCPFKHPCRAAMDGADFRTMLHEEFALSDHYKKEVVDDVEE